MEKVLRGENQHSIHKDRRPSSRYLHQGAQLCKVQRLSSKPQNGTKDDYEEKWLLEGSVENKNHHPLYKRTSRAMFLESSEMFQNLSEFSRTFWSIVK